MIKPTTAEDMCATIIDYVLDLAQGPGPEYMAKLSESEVHHVQVVRDAMIQLAAYLRADAHLAETEKEAEETANAAQLMLVMLFSNLSPDGSGTPDHGLS